MAIAGGGLTRELGESLQMILLDATSLDKAGFVLTYKLEGGKRKVDKCGATDIPAAVDYRSTRKPLDLNEPPTIFQTGADIGAKGIEVFREGWMKLQLATNNAALVLGDTLVCTGGGKVDKYTPTTITNGTNTASETETRFDELGRIVGHVEELAAIGAGTTSAAKQEKVLTKVSIRTIGIIT